MGISVKKLCAVFVVASILCHYACAESISFDKYKNSGYETSDNQNNHYIGCNDNIKINSKAVEEMGNVDGSIRKISNDGEDIKFGNGDGTKENPYEILDVDTVIDLAKAVRAGNSFSGKYIKSSTETRFDFRFNSKGAGYYLPIGTKDNPFNGIIDGKGIKFEGIKMPSDENNESGIFGCIGKDGEVKNITVDNGVFCGKECAGCIAGINYGTIDNCLVTGSVSCKGALGGISGINQGTIRCCGSLAKLKGSSDISKIGGIAGINMNDIECCYSTGSGVPCYTAGRNTGKINNCFYEIEQTGSLTNTKSGDKNGVGLDIFGMTGKRAIINMKGFDFENKWGVKNDSEPDPLGNCEVNYPKLRGGKVLNSYKSVRIPELNNYISVKITGDDMAIGKTLNADILLIDPNRPDDTGICKFQWYRENEKIDGAVFNSYKITKDDVEHTLLVTVESENYPGIVSNSLKIKAVCNSVPPDSQDKLPDCEAYNNDKLIYEDNEEYSGEFTKTSDQDKLISIAAAFAGVLLGSMSIMYLNKQDHLKM